MIDLEFIQQLMKVFDESGVDSLELDRGGTRVRLAKTPPSASNPDINIPSPAEPPRKVGLGAVPTEVDLSESFQGDLLEITAPIQVMPDQINAVLRRFKLSPLKPYELAPLQVA